MTEIKANAMPASASSRPALTLYFDGSCALCRSQMQALAAHDAAQQLRFVDCAAPDFAGGPAPRAALMQAIHAVDAAGQVHVGVAALRLACTLTGLRHRAAWTAWPVLRTVAEWAYRLLARHRHRLPRWLLALLTAHATRRGPKPLALLAHSSCSDGVCHSARTDAGPPTGARHGATPSPQVAGAALPHAPTPRQT